MPYTAQQDIRHSSNHGALTDGSPKSWGIYNFTRIAIIEETIGVPWYHDRDAARYAHLLAAAPDLLLALELVVGSEPNDNDSQGLCSYCGQDNGDRVAEPCHDEYPGQIARRAIARAKDVTLYSVVEHAGQLNEREIAVFGALRNAQAWLADNYDETTISASGMLIRLDMNGAALNLIS